MRFEKLAQFIFWRKRMANPLENVVTLLRKKLIAELGFRLDPNEEKSLIKDISGNFGMVFYHDEENPLSFGFYHYNDKNFSPEQKKWLCKEVFGRWEFSENFDFYEWGDQWICKRFLHKSWANEDIITFLFSRYEWLEKTVRYLEIT
jgi:hypothetical protein